MNFKPSAAANKEGVCCTREEAQAAYDAFTKAKKDPAIAYLREWIRDIDKPVLRMRIAADPEGWIAPHHFWWGMSVRNALRDGGFGEKYWPIHNLDCIYVRLVEEALAQ